ncbi:MAG TPA: metalloregulator ArsR/SmtB family transcription factor [Candidatus Saccharimonadia bacterium]|nr:metalloregulator ArsR/SmtB family transcription factor [Candidatus Saccharimonadia bacterium]
MFSALAEPTRLSIIDMLAARGELSAGEIAHAFTSSAAAISQHLKVLREARLVVVKKQAQQRRYQLNPAQMAELESWLHARTAQWNGRLDSMSDYLNTIK